MKPRHKALALAHAAAAPAEADAADSRAPGAAAFGGGGGAAPPFHFAAGASTSAAVGGAPPAVLSAKRVRKAVTASRGGAAASRRGGVPSQPAAATAARPTQAAAPTDEPSMEVKRRYKGVYWCVAEPAHSALSADAELFSRHRFRRWVTQGVERQEVGGAVRAGWQEPPPGHIRRLRPAGSCFAMGRKAARAGPHRCVLSTAFLSFRSSHARIPRVQFSARRRDARCGGRAGAAGERGGAAAQRFARAVSAQAAAADGTGHAHARCG